MGSRDSSLPAVVQNDIGGGWVKRQAGNPPPVRCLLANIAPEKVRVSSTTRNQARIKARATGKRCRDSSLPTVVQNDIGGGWVKRQAGNPPAGKMLVG